MTGLRRGRRSRPGRRHHQQGRCPAVEEAPVGFGSLFGKNVTLTGGPAPVRAYIEELLPEVLDGRLEPRRVFDRTVFLDDVPAGYRAMDDCESIEVLVAP